MLNTKNLSLNSKIVQNPGNVVSDMDGEKVMLNVSRGKYYNLGELGGEIWECISNPIMINSLITTLLLHYEVEKGECEQQVLTFINSLYQEGLIEIVD